ncbi:hypothetical protein RP20_CCG016313 [Aedes albopictus]|nr:hypothetical protein RP20_CCG016313 [Aedes albopictus]
MHNVLVIRRIPAGNRSLRKIHNFRNQLDEKRCYKQKNNHVTEALTAKPSLGTTLRIHEPWASSEVLWRPNPMKKDTPKIKLFRLLP